MNVGELIKELQELDPNLPVLTARDPEGNGYNLTSTVYTGYRAESLDSYEYNELVHQEDIYYERALLDDDDDDWYDPYENYNIPVVVIG